MAHNHHRLVRVIKRLELGQEGVGRSGLGMLIERRMRRNGLGWIGSPLEQVHDA
jgi:hypothetical protein